MISETLVFESDSLNQSEAAETGQSLPEILAGIWRRPGEVFLREWNWKAAFLSSLFRAAVFLFANLSSGLRAASGAMFAEFLFRAATAGFYGSLTQRLRLVTPAWQGSISAMILLPAISHSLEFAVHLARGTPKLKTSMIASICFTLVSTLFNIYAMRRGAMIVGAGSNSLAADFRRVPALLAGFLSVVPIALWRAAGRLFGDSR